MPTTAATKAERTYMDGDMSKRDLVMILEDLRFGPRSSFQILAIDQQVRDFLLSLLKK